MHQKLLLGSTALVGAGLVFASANPAQAQIEVTLSGYTEFGAGIATKETFRNDASDRGYGFFMDTEIHVGASGTSDAGVDYGTVVELEVFQSDEFSETVADEALVFLSGNFGRIELGREDGAEDVMFVGGEDTQAGTGGIDGDTENLLPFQIQDTGDAAKVTYFTPRVAGFQLGASYTPDEGDDYGLDAGDDFEDSIGAGVNWEGSLVGLDLIVSAVGIWAENEDDDVDDKLDWSVGFNTGIAGFEIGASYIQFTDFNEADLVNAGIGYGFGPVNTSVGWVWIIDTEEGEDEDIEDDTHLFVVSADVGLMPGLVLKGDVSYNTEDAFSSADDPGDETIAGVLTLQLNY